jgi:hypothetical protein
MNLNGYDVDKNKRACWDPVTHYFDLLSDVLPGFACPNSSS